VGSKEEGKWQETERERLGAATEGWSRFPLGPCRPDAAKGDGLCRAHDPPQRPKGVNFSKGKEGALTRAAFCKMVAGAEWKEELRVGMADTQGSQTQLVADQLVKAAHQARSQVQADKV
jgi:hypothetical protein